MDSSKRMVLVKALKAARATKAGASSAPAADPSLPLSSPSPTPTTTETPLGPSSPPPCSPQTLQTPSSPPPIAAVPLAVASSPAPAPRDKGKRVLEILSDDEDSDGGVSFKRRKAARVPTLPAASPQGGDSFRDNPPSATSPPPTIVQEEKGEGAESAPPPPPAEVSADPASISAAPDLIAIPPPIMHLMRGFNGRLMPEGSDRKEGMPFYLGAILAVALDWRAQARNITLNAQALQTLEARVAALEEEKKALGRQNEAYQASLKLAQEAKEEAERQLGEAMEFQVDFYVREISLQVQITDLQDMAEASKELQKDLEDQCYGQAEKLEWMEEEMATQAKTLNLLQVNHDKLQIEVSWLRVEKEALEKQVASGDSTIEELEKAKKALIDDMAGTFEEGFKEALAQAACENPGINVSNCDSTHHVVDGRVVPLELDD
ncbi:uncharacterized protein [Phaseolus vulgaris]|uniref:uncharacterized protein n=1 Tax=Phaseolus vulgaris TaxID=3885 RepID=UPI0035CC58CC